MLYYKFCICYIINNDRSDLISTCELSKKGAISLKIAVYILCWYETLLIHYDCPETLHILIK